MQKKRMSILLFSIIISSFILAIISYQAIPINAMQKTNIEICDKDDLLIEFEVEGPDITGEDKLDIVIIKVNSTETNATVLKSEMDVYKYHIYADKAGTNEVLSGDLEWVSKREYWEIRDIDLAWTGFGIFYVTVEFQSEDMKDSQETDIDEDYSYERMSATELMIYIIIGAGAVIGLIILFLVIKAKRQGVSIERKQKETKKEVKIQEISKDELKRAKKKEKEQKKEKGKTEVKEDLIFSVPEWEVDDED